MLVGNMAISLNLLSIAVLAFAIGVMLIAITSSFCFAKLELVNFGARKAILWSLVTAPWWIAFSCVVFFWPRQQDVFPTAWLNDFAHWHHVEIFSYTSWHAITLFTAGLFLSWLLASTVYYRRKQSYAMSDLLDLAEVHELKTKGQHCFYSLPFSVPAAFTTGFISPKIYLTTALRKQVSEQELDIIIKHELAHVESRDPLFKVVFALLSEVYPRPIRRKLIRQFTLLTEQMADYAVTLHYDNLDVAQTLINVARMQRGMTMGCNDSQMSYFGNDQTSVRVQRLISSDVNSPRLAMSFTLLFFTAAPLLTASAVDNLHHFIETFFTH